VPILIVDDEPESRKLLSTILTEDGHQVRAADGGELALAAIDITRPRLIVLDIRMPGMSGFDVCRRLKTKVDTRGIPVLFISASEDLAERLEGLRLGAVDFITKPFQREELLARVRTHLELGKLRAHLEEEVEKRTAELTTLNEELRKEIQDRLRAQEMNRALAGRLITSQEDERARIGRELHDGVCQELAAVGIDLSRLRQKSTNLASDEAQESLRALQSRIASVVDSIQTLSHDLHPYVLQQLGLEAALQAHCVEVNRHLLEVTFRAEGMNCPLSQLVELSLFRITQEALRNAVRHGHARRAAVSLVRDVGHLTLTIADAGAGFDVSADNRQRGLGLVSMEERACLAQGRFSIESQPGEGTTIEVRVPVAVADDVAAGGDSRNRS
jgi:signal transduction histidine kinase